MKKILITRKLIKESEDKAAKIFDPIFNNNDELYSQLKIGSKVFEALSSLSLISFLVIKIFFIKYF